MLSGDCKSDTVNEAIIWKNSKQSRFSQALPKAGKLIDRLGIVGMK